MFKPNTNTGSYGNRYINDDRTNEVYPNYQDPSWAWETTHDQMSRLGWLLSDLPLRTTKTPCHKCEGQGNIIESKGRITLYKRCDRCVGTKVELQDIS